MKRILQTLFSVMRMAVGLKPRPVIRYVRQGGAGNADGTSWANAAEDLQATIKACPKGSEVWVATGEYWPKKQGHAFVMKEGVRIYGGFPMPDSDKPDPAMDSRDWRVNPTILKGNGRRVVYNKCNRLTAAAVLDGFVIEGGRTNDKGGGIYNQKVSPTFVNLIVRDNHAWTGGGIFQSGGILCLSEVTVTGNLSHWDGAGIYSNDCKLVLANVTISNNVAEVGNGGGMCNRRTMDSSILKGVIVKGNSSASGGGGIFNSCSSPVLINVAIDNNETSGDGGGMYNSDSSPVLDNVTINSNRTIGDGGGIFNEGNSSPMLNQVTITSNLSGQYHHLE
ncbi:hypothetical protein [Parapedobacter koreensis]|uniref:Right handed beta helix region n=1 Tax=Parapedobacter koreensis TaxID=332977 RepID=A0A1H7TJV1_9SPHI|nr:hypothetical protein [Parapedobacter koreensis]SEL84825.1 hypothetical protein SAMN05421740_111100 [Parapedobacter koreensis]